jgi:hypothetical protein
MLQKGLKDFGILRDTGSSAYHKLNPTSIGILFIPILAAEHGRYAL